MKEAQGIGWCFVCQIIVCYEEAYSLEVESLEFTKKQFKEDRTPKVFTLDWTQPALNSPVASRFLLEERQVPEEKIVSYDLRYASVGGWDVIVFPDDEYAGEVRFFQYRILGDWYGAKYVTITSTPLMWISRVNPGEDLILVEGVIDSILTGAVPILGTTLSEGQIIQLRERCLQTRYKRLIVALDGEVKNEDVQSLCNLIKSEVTSEIPVCVTGLPDNADPADAVLAGYWNDVLENVAVFN